MLDTIYKNNVKCDEKEILIELVYANCVDDICTNPDNETFIFHTLETGVSGLQGECVAPNGGTAYMKATVKQEKITQEEENVLLSAMNSEAKKLFDAGMIKEYKEFI